MFVRRVVLAACLSSSLFAARLSTAGGLATVYANQSHLMGSRAAGMGGAYTALACDEAALHYNVAGLGCAEHSHLELVANAYMVQSYSLPRALGEGQDLKATTYHSIPSAVGAVYIVSRGEPETRRGRQAFGFLVTVPASISLKSEPTNTASRNYLTTSIRDDVLAGDIGYAYQLGTNLTLGVSAGGLLRTSNTTTAFLVTRPLALPGVTGNEFVSASTEVETLAIGLRAKVGVRWTPTRSLAFGWQLTTPTWDVYGSYRQSYNVATATLDASGPSIDATPVRFSGASGAGFPLRFAVGAAYLGKGYTLSADASVNLPRSIKVASQVVPQRVAGLADADASPITLERVVQPNVALGAEVRLTPEVAVEVGAFTDLSSVPRTSTNEDHLDMFGGSLALTLLGAQTRGTFGLSFSYGSAETRVASGAFTLDAVSSAGSVTSTVSRWNLIGMIGSNYSFLPDDVAAKAMKKDRDLSPP